MAECKSGVEEGRTEGVPLEKPGTHTLIEQAEKQPAWERILRAFYLWILVIVGSLALLLLSYELLARAYFPELTIPHILYATGFTERPDSFMQPGKGFGHKVGYAGSGLILLALVYYTRRHAGSVFTIGSRRFWLDTHIFLGLLGTILITVHTALKIGGLVSISYWSMILVVVSGVIGRYIFTLIPRSIAGNELGREVLSERLELFMDRARELEIDPLEIEEASDRIAGSERIQKRRHLGAVLFVLLDRIGLRWRFFREKKRFRRGISSGGRKQLKVLFDIMRKQAMVKRRIALLEKYMETLEFWRPIHVRLSILMFTFMIFHIVIALFFKVEN